MRGEGGERAKVRDEVGMRARMKGRMRERTRIRVTTKVRVDYEGENELG